jgi:hypothetical protein
VPAPLAVFSTDKATYQVTSDSSGLRFTVITTYRNANNLPIMLERIEGGSGDSRTVIWYQQLTEAGVPIGDANGPPCACSEATGLILQPGEIHTDTVAFYPTTVPASYRVYISAQLCTMAPTPTACGAELPLSDRVSTAFAVMLPSVAAALAAPRSVRR